MPSNGQPDARATATAAASARRARGVKKRTPVAPGGAYCSVFPGPDDEALNSELVQAVRDLEASFGKPACLLIQPPTFPPRPMSMISDAVWKGLFVKRGAFTGCEGVVLVLHSLGGFASSAYQIAKLLRRHCGGFDVVVPREAKSAATLLALGADRIFLAQDAELGPLDAQVFDPEREEGQSALDEVQALERLQAAALEQFDRTMFVLQSRSDLRSAVLIPMALQFVSETIRPLLEKIDTVHYTQQSRVLKVAEDYALRLLAARYDGERARQIAGRLVEKYPEHAFVIDRDEAATFIQIDDATEEQQAVIERLADILTVSPVTAIGRLQEVNDVSTDDSTNAGS